MRILPILALLLALLVAFPASAQKVVTLPPGKQIKVLGVGKISFSEGPPGLMLKYETDLSVDDKSKLEKEVAEIWATFRPDVEKAQLTVAIISANEHPSGMLVTTNKGFNFVYERGSDGKWSRTK